MPRKPTIKKTTPVLSSDQIANLVDEKIKNNFGNAIGFNWMNGLQGNGIGTNPFAPQISQVNSLFDNMRWYAVSNMRQPLSEAYMEIGLIQTVVDVPVDDGLRGGIKLQSKMLSEEQLRELMTSIDRDDDLNTAAQAAKWNRLFGGAGILILTNQDPETPLDLNSISKDSELEFRAVDMWELFWDKQNTEGYDPELQTQEFEFYNYYSKKLHKSRVMRLKGMTAPSFIRPRLRGWGFSVVEPLIRSINQYLKSTTLSFACLDEFKVDVYKIKNLINTLLSPNGEQKVKQRITMANWQKNYQNALVMDSEDDWDHKQLSFAGLAETMQGIRMQVAADMRMPITKLFGTSASAGIGNTDQNDMENYNSMVESQVRNKLKYDLLRMAEIKCQFLFGFIPDDLTLEFKPLRELTAEQEENVKTSKFNRALSMRQAGEIDSKTFRDICNSENLLGIQLDNIEDLMNPVDPSIGEAVLEEDHNPEKSEDVDDPGANRTDRRKPRAWDDVSLTNEANLDMHTSVKELPNPPMTSKPDPEAIAYRADLDYMSYQKEGGDDWISEPQLAYYKFPQDEHLWQHAKSASLKYTGSNNHKFTIWYYRKMGGQFGGSPKVSNKIHDLSLERADQPANSKQLSGPFDLEPHTYADDPEYPLFRSLYDKLRDWLTSKANRDIRMNEDYKTDYEKNGYHGKVYTDSYTVQNPGHVEESKWSKAKELSRKSYGEIKWPFVSYMYEKLGGHFSKKG